MYFCLCLSEVSVILIKVYSYFQCVQLEFRNSIVIQCCAVQNHALVRKM